ncbi:hypothetical protein CLV35_2133 [Motilibacter peucedani]|uniref:Uncharacterized protein n=1 Tax=Motilibacter peucedani TaxID=598650 RepID=A0A420XR14_9ACTN|nr:hypothetical protein [Motilibacter peucedani]RKS75656.1 hypothetical protein CLV35_2133 [Motilibacter peucedani]
MPITEAVDSISPAPGWTAVYREEHGGEHHVPLAGWALLGALSTWPGAVVGLVPARTDGRSVELVDEHDAAFVRYEYVRDLHH